MVRCTGIRYGYDPNPSPYRQGQRAIQLTAVPVYGYGDQSYGPLTTHDSRAMYPKLQTSTLLASSAQLFKNPERIPPGSTIFGWGLDKEHRLLCKTESLLSRVKKDPFQYRTSTRIFKALFLYDRRRSRRPTELFGVFRSESLHMLICQLSCRLPVDALAVMLMRI